MSDVQVDSRLKVRTIPRAEWDTAAVILIEAPGALSKDALEHIAAQARWFAEGKRVVVSDAALNVVIVPGGSDADASDAR